jgi:hypothetical protein
MTYPPDPIAQAKLMAELDELGAERLRLEHERADVIDRIKDALRRGNELGLSDAGMGLAVGIERQMVWKHRNSATAADHAFLDSIGAPE